jgi:transcriptional regulator of acetoin/glycerol metabolism
LRLHPWPGNLRELKNVVDYAVAMAAGAHTIRAADLPDQLLQATLTHASNRSDCPDTSPPTAPEPAGPCGPGGLPAEAQLLLQYLRAAGWNVTAVAHQLGVARMTVYRRMRRWGIREPERS